jgi:hypothetical protein
MLHFHCARGYCPRHGQLAPSVHSYNPIKSSEMLQTPAYYCTKSLRFYHQNSSATKPLQRGSITQLDFTRADLVNAQDIYGSPAAYQLGHGTHKAKTPYDDDRVPLHESVEQELQVDLFFFLGQVFLLSISLLLGLIMVTHLGPGAERRISDRPESHAERSKARAGASLMLHINQYTVKGFRIKRVTIDGEPTIKAAKHDIESIGVELNVLGHGSHTPHAESSISHIKKREITSS